MWENVSSETMFKPKAQTSKNNLFLTKTKNKSLKISTTNVFQKTFVNVRSHRTRLHEKYNHKNVATQIVRQIQVLSPL
jgi:hypothetical protein